MTRSNRPYLIRALYEWITDNNMTPHILVDTTVEGIKVPEKGIVDGKIVLNIAPAATTDLELGSEWILFNARFDARPYALQIPVNAVLAIYTRENGEGMIFTEESAGGKPGVSGNAKPKKPQLKIIK